MDDISGSGDSKGNRERTDLPSELEETQQVESEHTVPVAGAYGSDSIRSPEAGPPVPESTKISAIIYQAAPYMGASSVMTVAVLGGGFGGKWLDGKLGTSPLLLTLGLLGGVALGMYEIVRVATSSRNDRR
jgi:hypothetical protein